MQCAFTTVDGSDECSLYIRSAHVSLKEEYLYFSFSIFIIKMEINM